ncbi:hypothetical protein PAPYR_7307 [Paratrimastix pyriformis]|uniref:Uncharacterized protein n=1 Tax=Paratrimastix pyriformis TaxID=342808 RepID=A0ABQ8UIQ0_9EUKA|nr:hypothetical protein PAPYR_7307 [Paratrimastix pyriformis]
MGPRALCSGGLFVVRLACTQAGVHQVRLVASADAGDDGAAVAEGAALAEWVVAAGTRTRPVRQPGGLLGGGPAAGRGPGDRGCAEPGPGGDGRVGPVVACAPAGGGGPDGPVRPVVVRFGCPYAARQAVGLVLGGQLVGGALLTPPRTASRAAGWCGRPASGATSTVDAWPLQGPARAERVLRVSLRDAAGAPRNCTGLSEAEWQGLGLAVEAAPGPVELLGGGPRVPAGHGPVGPAGGQPHGGHPPGDGDPGRDGPGRSPALWRVGPGPVEADEATSGPVDPARRPLPLLLPPLRSLLTIPAVMCPCSCVVRGWPASGGLVVAGTSWRVLPERLRFALEATRLGMRGGEPAGPGGGRSASSCRGPWFALAGTLAATGTYRLRPTFNGPPTAHSPQAFLSLVRM